MLPVLEFAGVTANSLQQQNAAGSCTSSSNGFTLRGCCKYGIDSPHGEVSTYPYREMSFLAQRLAAGADGPAPVSWMVAAACLLASGRW